MKPRFRIRHGIWVCSFVDPATRMALYPMGHGYDQAGALAEWKAMSGEQG